MIPQTKSSEVCTDLCSDNIAKNAPRVFSQSWNVTTVCDDQIRTNKYLQLGSVSLEIRNVRKTGKWKEGLPKKKNHSVGSQPINALFALLITKFQLVTTPLRSCPSSFLFTTWLMKEDYHFKWLVPNVRITNQSTCVH